MKCHQILTGAVNSGDNTYARGSVEGIPFTAYCSGCNIVILASNFDRVQILPGVLYGNVQVNCVDASTDVGKIAACYGGPIKCYQPSRSAASLQSSSSSNRICIFEPTPILGQLSEHRLDYSWIKTAEIEPNSSVNVLSWNIEGTRLLTGGTEIQLWELVNQDSTSNDEGLRMKPLKSESKQQDWHCVWTCKTSTPVCHLSFSPSGTLFCSTGRADRLVKIWYESATQNQHISSIFESGSTNNNSQINQTSSSSSMSIGVGHSNSSVSFSFIYIAHPRAVTGISWRKVSKYMPKGSTANMLVTSCRDNICRLWIQTLLPEDGLVNVSQLDGVSNLVAPRSQTTRHRQKLLQRFKHMKSFAHFKRRQHVENGHNHNDHHEHFGLTRSTSSQDSLDHVIANLPSSFSVHDFHGFGVHGTSVTPGGLHFHLTATINAESDIPLVPSLTQHGSEMNINDGTKLGPKVLISNDDPRPRSPTVSASHHHHHHEESEKPLFVVNWLNNKEMSFTQGAEKILHDIVTNIIESERQQQSSNNESNNADQQADASCNDTENATEHNKSSPKVPSGISANLNDSGTQFASSHNSSSNNSLATVAANIGTDGQSNDIINRKTVADYLDRKLETLMREWHTSSDLLYSIHPLDGSLLIWLVEWLDEPTPATFRQPQISFSARIPNSIPLWDASTMSHNIALYSASCFLDLKSVLCISSQTNLISATLSGEANGSQVQQSLVTLAHNSQQQHYQQQQPLFGICSSASSTLCMITKHNNGSLNLWKLSFSERSQFTQLMNISHSRRVCGHRFRVNDASCHPILPLLLTTSHHNLSGQNSIQSRKSGSSPFELRTPNTPDSTSFLVSPSKTEQQGHGAIVESNTLPNMGFCSELILWKVEPVGPLLKSGGVSELARINSLESTAFANVAWIPTLLSSTALGSIQNSPSACFVASDGRQLRIYQAVIDARSLLPDAQRYNFNTNDSRQFYYDSSDEEDSISDVERFKSPNKLNQKRCKSEPDSLRSLFKIVSLQSTSRPGAVLELSPIVDARHDWQNTQLLHVFQEQLVLGNQIKPLKNRKDIATNEAPEISLPDGPVIDLSHGVFEEVFYLVVVTKTTSSSTLHMWQITISSRDKANLDDMNSTDCQLQQQEEEESSRSVSPESNHKSDSNQSPPLRIKTRKVCVQALPLPPDVEVIHAAPAAGHLSSSNIYPACYAPFLLSTVCSDNKVRFWRCQVTHSDDDSSNETNFTWLEWEMNLKIHSSRSIDNDETNDEQISSSIELPGSPLYVSCAYSGRVACAYKMGHSYADISSTSPEKEKDENRFINIGIGIYECQSSGGSEWILEDTIKIERIPLLDANTVTVAKMSQVDLNPLVDTTKRNTSASRALVSRLSSNSLSSYNPFHVDISQPQIDSFDASTDHTHQVANIQRLLSVPSYTTIQSLKKIIAEQGNQFTFFQKSPVLLDWVSTEDGSHILSCSAGHKVILFAPVSQRPTDTAIQKAPQTTTTTTTTSTLIPQQSFSSTSVSPSKFRTNLLEPLLNTLSITRWMVLRMTELESVDGLPPLPMQLSWVRDGIMVVGMDNEMLIFTQWKMPMAHALPMLTETKSVEGHKQLMASPYPLDSVDVSSDCFVALSKGKEVESKFNDLKSNEMTNEEKIIYDLPDDFGLFEAFRQSSPVIPQYHPKQLMELLAFGKIHRVRAILSHLVTSLCSISSIKEYLHRPSNLSQQPGSSFEAERSPRSWTRTRALSIAQQPSPHDVNSPMDNSYGEAPIVAEEIQLDYTEIASIRPLPLYALMQADEGISSEKALEKDKSNQSDSNLPWSLNRNETLDADVLFEYSYKTQVEETLDEFLGNRSAFNFSNIATSKFLKQASQSANEFENDVPISIHFDQRKAGLLSKLLTHSHLPGLTSLDQMHLLALADSLASFNDLSDKQEEPQVAVDTIDEQLFSITANSLDDCGLRYLLNMRQHVYLLKCLPLMQRKSLQQNGLGLHNIIWAFHSETQEELVQLLTSNSRVSWQDLREVGVGFWVRNNALLRKLIEKLAKSAFKANNDPLDASIYYLAMRKKNLVWGLYRSIQDRKMTDFFSHDFTEDKWRKAALKNAYALMGKQRFEHAVSFFLLAGSLWDAVEICLNKLDDLQLAMIIIRLYEGGDLETVPETLKKLLHQEILGYRQGVQDLSYAHPDPFLRSMAHWMLHEYNLALSTLLEVNVGSKHSNPMPSAAVSRSNYATPLPPMGDTNFEGLHPSVFNFYLYLRTQPLIVRRAQVAQQTVKTGGSSLIHQNRSNESPSKTKRSHMFNIGTANRSDAVAITPFERRLFFLTAHRHLRAGCPALALEVLSRLPTNIMSYMEKNEIEECSRRMSLPDTATSIGHISESNNKPTIFDKPSKAEDLFNTGSFDWGAPSSIFKKESTDEFKITFDDDGDNADEEEDDGLEMKDVTKEDDKQTNIKSETDQSNKIDIMAQQFKFISCLKIMMEEMSTLATGFEVDGGQLRYQLYIWLERSVQNLKEICNYHTFSLRTAQSRGSIDNVSGTKGLVPPPMLDSITKSNSILINTCPRKQSDNSTNLNRTAPSLHEILIADKQDFESKMERCRRRKTWLTANEALLRNLLSYCSLHGAHGGGLASVRMELILLLQELQQDRSPQQQLLSPLPLPTTLPLLTASVASQKTVVADPIRHLQSMIQDILQSLVDVNTYVHMPTRSNYSSLPDFLALPPFMVSGTSTNLTSWATLQDGQQSNSYASTLYNLIHILRDLGISLSSCVYQSLCDCDTVIQNCSISSNNSRLNRFQRNHLSTINKKPSIASHSKDMSATNLGDQASQAQNDENKPCTAPNKWPGVQSLHAMIVREKDEDLPKLHTLLCEAFVAVYLSQLVYALTVCDSSILYRLVGFKFNEKSWSDLFGGGIKKLLYVSAPSATMAGLGTSPGNSSPNEFPINVSSSNNSPHIDLLTSLAKQRQKLHTKILEQLNQAGAAAAEAVSAVSTGMVNVATSPSSTFQNIGNQIAVPLSGNMTSTGTTSGTTTERPTYRDMFVPPQSSIVNYLMLKPELADELVHLDYDSMCSDDDGENEDDINIGDKFKAEDEIDDEEYDNWANEGKSTSSKPKVDYAAEKRKANLEYELYAWCIIRLSVSKIAYEQIDNFLSVSGLERGDLPTTSSSIHSILKTLKRWQYAMQFYMNEFTNLPDRFLPNMYVDSERTSGPTIHKYKSLLETNNTPFRSGYTSVKASKRLWNYLVRQKSVQDIFIRYIFAKSRSIKLAREHGATAICNSISGTALNEVSDTSSDHKTMQPTSDDGSNQHADLNVSNWGNRRIPEPMRIVHKDQDQISAFCVNRSNAGLIALSTQKEIQELNIKPLLDACVPWMEEDTEMDILNLRQKQDLSYSSSSYVDFLLVQHPSDRLQTSPGGQAIQRQASTISQPGQQQTPTKQTILIKRHKTETVRRLASHPSLPLYLSGGQDGSVNLWEWNHQTPISAPRAAGTFAKVTRVQFNQQGNKFGVADTDGNLSLWQVSATHNKPFFTYPCHNKTISDFTFLGSSSLLMTAGHSTDHKNVVLWDTLMPSKKCMISSFACHENGASSIMYAPLNQLLLTGGKKGEIFIFDMRQRTQRDRFQAHEGAVKCIALDPGEEFFATGSSDGDIKVWSLIGPTRTLMFSFMQEHSRSTFFRNMGMGVSHLYIDHCGRLFSCGADGSLKMRHLPTVECQPKWFFSPTSSSTQSALYGFENDTTGVNGIVNTI